MKKTSFILLLSVAFFSACVVSKKKFDEVNAKKSQLEVDKASLEEQLKGSQGENERLANQLLDCVQRRDSLVSDTARTGVLFRDLIEKYTQLSKASSEDAKNLSRQLDKVSLLRDELHQKDKAIQDEELKIAQLSKALVEREKRVAELEKILSDQEKAVKELKNKISQALLSFKESDLTVEMRDGKVYVSVSEQLLFQSGSYAVDEKGQDALKKLANVLKDNKDIDIVVEGHTDDVPLSPGATLKDNWDLSVLRATSIVRIITSGGVDPKRVSASGRSEYLPKVAAKTKEARSKNRRTEIIISPQLKELYKILDGVK